MGFLKVLLDVIARIGVHDPAGKLKKLLDQKIVTFVLVQRVYAAPSGGKKPKTEREWFDQCFRIMTSAAKSP
jgi:hypothetical protein